MYSSSCLSSSGHVLLVTNRSYGYNVVIMCSFIYVTHSTHSVDFNGTTQIKIMEEYFTWSPFPCLHAEWLTLLSVWIQLIVYSRREPIQLCFAKELSPPTGTGDCWNSGSSIFNCVRSLSYTNFLQALSFIECSFLCWLSSAAYWRTPLVLLNYPVTGNVLNNNPLLTNH